MIDFIVYGYLSRADKKAHRWVCWDFTGSRLTMVVIVREYEADGLLTKVVEH